MAHLKLFLTRLRRVGKYPLFVVAALLLIIWGAETPPGILGKADAIGYAVCHRIDVRSFHIGIQQLPLCARCTGQYVGAVIGFIFQAIFARHRSGFPSKRVLVILGLLSVVYAVDGLNSYLYLPPIIEAFPHLPHLYLPSNTLRLLTGSGMGLVIAAILYPAFVGTLYSRVDSRPAIAGIKPMLTLIGLCLIADLLILTGSSFVLYPAALISSAGVIILLSFAYTIVILRIFKKENTFIRFSQAGLPLFAGFVLTMLQIGLFDLVRFFLTGNWSGFVFG
jgi:uncharacterized membrane protein